MPPDPTKGSRLRRSQNFPSHWTDFSLIVRRLDTLPPCVFISCIAKSSNINYLVPVLEVRTPHEKSWLRACLSSFTVLSQDSRSSAKSYGLTVSHENFIYFKIISLFFPHAQKLIVVQEIFGNKLSHKCY